MQYCSKCHVQIRGHKKCCPLCQGSLEGSPENSAFPYIKQGPVSAISFMKIAIFVTLIMEVGLAVLYYVSHYKWSWIPMFMLTLLALLGDLAIAGYYRNNMLRLFHVEFYIGMLIAYIVDRKTGFYGWSITWMIPGTLMALILCTWIIARIVRLHLIDYVIYVAIDVILTLLQAIPLLRHMNRMPLFAILTMAFAIIYGAAVVLFRFKDLKYASQKYLNV